MYEDVFSSSANIGQQVSHHFFPPGPLSESILRHHKDLNFHITSAGQGIGDSR